MLALVGVVGEGVGSEAVGVEEGGAARRANQGLKLILVGVHSCGRHWDSEED